MLNLVVTPDSLYDNRFAANQTQHARPNPGWLANRSVTTTGRGPWLGGERGPWVGGTGRVPGFLGCHRVAAGRGRGVGDRVHASDTPDLPDSPEGRYGFCSAPTASSTRWHHPARSRTAGSATAHLRGVTPSASDSDRGGARGGGDLPTVINNATGWLVGILAALATFFLTLGGIRYMAADGNPGEVERAKGALRSAGIGYGLAILAPVVLTVLKKILGI